MAYKLAVLRFWKIFFALTYIIHPRYPYI